MTGGTFAPRPSRMLAALCVAVTLNLTASAAEGGDIVEIESPPRIVNVINFIRAVEPRVEIDLYKPVVEQVRLARETGLPASFLLQYDALLDPKFVELVKEAEDLGCEAGGWFEVVQPQVEKAGLEWRGRYPWDWHTDVGFSVGYTPEEREKLVDVFMDTFQEVFGRLPRSVGSWFIDAHTLGYMADRYGVMASCNCKDQIGTDGYTLWGGYWNQAYYPSRTNSIMPAQTVGNQIPIPVFRMLGSDPIYQYEANRGTGHQSVVSLEPVYKEGGGDPVWVRWFFDVMTQAPCGAFAYAQVGQENSFGWDAMGTGLTEQMRLLKELSDKGEVRVETLETSAHWFRQKYLVTPATCVAALKDWSGKDRRAVWYNSRFYRASVIWEEGGLRIRDIHTFDETYAERYLQERVTTNWCIYDTLPVCDGHQWGAAEEAAGMTVALAQSDGTYVPCTGGDPSASEPEPGVLTVAWPVDGGVVRLKFEEDGFEATMDGSAGWCLDLAWSEDKTPPIESVSETLIRYRYNGHSYSVALEAGGAERVAGESRIRIRPADGRIRFRLTD